MTKILLSAKAKLDAIEVLIFRALIDLCITQDGFVSVNNMLKEYNVIR